MRYPDFIDSIRIKLINELSEVVKTFKLVPNSEKNTDTIWSETYNGQGKIIVLGIAFIQKSIQYRDSAIIQYLQNEKFDTVKFFSNNALFDTRVTRHATSVTDIPVLQDASEIFAGWYYTDAKGLCLRFTKETPVISNMVVTAKWGCVDIDGNVYKTVQIGNQRWLAENFKSTHYNDGKEIPFYSDVASWITDTSGQMSYDTLKSNFGFLYNWYAVNSKKFAPNGWHVPSQAEFDTLLTFLSLNNYNYDSSTVNNKVAKALATNMQLSWDDYKINSPGTPGLEIEKNNKSGFNAIPMGLRKDSGQFRGYRQFAWYWCADSHIIVNNAMVTMIEYDSNYVFIRGRDKNYGCSVRLIKGN